VEAENRFEIFTSEILLTRQANTLVYWAQNIINRFSVRYRIESQHAIVLSNRRVTRPIPAVRGLVTERQTMKNGLIRDIVLDGKCTWRVWNLQRVQDEIDTAGLEAFMRECQHDVERTAKGQMLHNWNDKIHVISTSEFESKFLVHGMPASWPKDWGNDWARTKSARHANVAFFRTVSPMNSALPGMTFVFHPMSFIEDSQPEDVAERLLSCLEPGPLNKEFRDKHVTWEELRREELLRADAVRHTRTTLERIEYERGVIAEVLPKLVEPVLKKHCVIGGVNSHERDDIRRIYGTVFGLGCRGQNPGKFGGVEAINRNMKVDYTTPHAFRPDQMGFTRWYVVVPDDTTQEPMIATVPVNGQVRHILVYPPAPFANAISPEALHDDQLFRYQMPNWRTRPAVVTVAGEVIDNPEKANDDFGNTLQMLEEGGPLDNTPLSIEEEFEMLIPETSRLVEGETMSLIKQQQQEVARFGALLQLEDKYGADFLFEEQEEEEYW
jgi:hypothetical protein